MNYITIILASVAVVLLGVLIIVSYVKAPPSHAFIISGISKLPRVLIGKGGFKVPFFERLDTIFLGQVTVDVKTQRPVPTHDFINVNIDAVTKVRVIPSKEGIQLAAKNFLNFNEKDIANQIQDTLEGNIREICGAMGLEEINTNRDAFSDQIQQKASPDMAKLGLEILSCNIQNVTDDNNLIRDLGADNTFAIKKKAAMTKALAEKDIAVTEANAKKEANDARAAAETEIAERNNELAIKKAELKKESDTKQAEADAAYEIQKQEQQKQVNTKTVEAEIEKTKKEQVLSNERIKVKQNELTAQVNANADAQKYKMQIDAEANKYKVQTDAEAALEQQKREAEARAYNAEQEAAAIKAKADAAKYAALQEAAGVEARGKAEAYAKQAFLEAEAEGIRAKGLAEAEAMEKKAEAYERYGEVAVIDMITKMYQSVLPDVAKNIAEPMSKIDGITIYGTTGNEASGVAGNVPVVMRQALDTVKDSTGIDLKDLVDAHSKSARTDRNINVGVDKGKTVEVDLGDTVL